MVKLKIMKEKRKNLFEFNFTDFLVIIFPYFN